MSWRRMLRWDLVELREIDINQKLINLYQIYSQVWTHIMYGELILIVDPHSVYIKKFYS